MPSAGFVWLSSASVFCCFQKQNGKFGDVHTFPYLCAEQQLNLLINRTYRIMAENNNEQQQIKIELKPEVAQGEYSNLAMINHASSEFVIDFAHMLPIAPPQIFSRVIMAPEHAKRLMLALQENIGRYEQEFGPIKLPQAPQEDGRTIAPFGTGKA